MSQVEAQAVPAPDPQVQEDEAHSEGSGAVEAVHAETDGEHEASDVVDVTSEGGTAESVAEEKPAEDDADVAKDTEPASADMPKENTQPATSPPASPAKKVTAKSSISVKPPAGKTAGGPPTPLVKKVRVISVKTTMKAACARHAQSINAAHRSSIRARLGLVPSRLHLPGPRRQPRLPPERRLRPPLSRSL